VTAANGENLQLVKAVVCAGLYPNIILIEPPAAAAGGSLDPLSLSGKTR
jgi:hypothetical protein